MSRPVASYVISNLMLVLVIGVTISNGSKTNNVNQCSRHFSGHFYNLLSLARNDGQPRFQTGKQGWNFAYNPCIPFSIKPPSACEEVAVCRWDKNDQSFTNLGYQNGSLWQSSQEGVEIVFGIPKSQHWITTIRLKCDQSRKGVDDGLLSIVHDTSNPVLQLEHNCCCPDACPDDSPTRSTQPTQPTQPIQPIKPIKPTPAPSTGENTYSIVGEIIGGFLGLLLIVGCIIFYSRRRRNQNRRNGENRPLMVDPEPRYLAVANRDPDDEAPDPSSEESDPDDGASDHEGEAPDPNDEAPDPEGRAPEPEGQASDPEVEVPAPESEAPIPVSEARGPEGEEPASISEASNPDGHASDSHFEVSVSDGEAPDADDEASDPDYGAPILANNRRGESPHIADVIPRIRDENLSHPVAVESSPEDQCCEEEPSPNAREPVEHSLEHSL